MALSIGPLSCPLSTHPAILLSRSLSSTIPQHPLLAIPVFFTYSSLNSCYLFCSIVLVIVSSLFSRFTLFCSIQPEFTFALPILSPFLLNVLCSITDCPLLDSFCLTNSAYPSSLTYLRSFDLLLFISCFVTVLAAALYLTKQIVVCYLSSIP